VYLVTGEMPDELRPKSDQTSTNPDLSVTVDDGEEE